MEIKTRFSQKYQYDAGQMTKTADTPLYGKPFEPFFSSTGGLISTKLSM